MSGSGVNKVKGLKDRIRRLVVNESTFLKRIGVVLSGSVLAQALPILVAPILSRLYSPNEIGVFGLFAAAVSTAAVVSTLRYETAILVPRTHYDAASLVFLCFFTTIACSVLFWALGIVGGAGLRSSIGLEHLDSLWIWIPMGGLFLAIFQTLSTWFVRSVKFKSLSTSRVSVSATMALLQVIGGTLKWGSFGLIVGQLVGQALGFLVFARSFWKTDRRLIQAVTFESVRNMAVKYRRFPMFSLVADLANVLANSMPLFLIGAYFGPAVVGFFALTQRVLAAPVSVIGTAVLDVFKERAATDYREHGSCRSIYRKTFLGLSLLAVPPALLLFVAAPLLFALVFGEEWREAGEYARLMAPLLLVRFVASPLSYVLYIAQKQHVDLVWQLCLLAVVTFSIMLGAQLGSARACITLFSAGFTIMYLVYLFVSYYYAKDHKCEVKQQS